MSDKTNELAEQGYLKYSIWKSRGVIWEDWGLKKQQQQRRVAENYDLRLYWRDYNGRAFLFAHL